ncbi:MAG: ferritin-like protein, partial [Planctomycetaceae bacterium]|nr:ferritin-like protein [Planctomycetaceae bacterium]
MSRDADSIESLTERSKRALHRAGTTVNQFGGGDPPGLEQEAFFHGENPRDLLIKNLVVAAKLEFATIPPYLCALWSIDDELHPAAESIREVVQEEMLHLALVSNLLVALEAPIQFRDWVPKYPAPLPGEVHAGLELQLQGFGDDALRQFMQIESPAVLPENVDRESGDPYWPEGHKIGEFYEVILALFRDLRPPLSTKNQVTGALSWRSIATLADVEWAIRTIQHQGEGAVAGPLDSGKSDLAHYYRFLELWKGKKLQFDKTDRHFYWRGKLNKPAHRKMAPVPNGGYTNVTNPIVALHLQK